MAANTENITGIVQHRRGKTAEWKLSPIVPYEGELVIEECDDGTCRCKIGDGSNTFEYLPYVDAATETSVETLKTQVELNSSNIKTLNTNVSNLKREVTGIRSAVQSIVDPRIEKLDTLYDTRLNTIEAQHNSDVKELYKAIDENAKELTKSFKNNLEAHAVEAANAIDTKVTEASLELFSNISSVKSDLQKRIVELEAGQVNNESSINSVNNKLSLTSGSLSDSINRINAGELKINELIEEVTKLKELGYGDIVTSEMIGQLRAVEAKVELLNTSDTNVQTQLYSVQASLSNVTRQLKELKDRHSADLDIVKDSVAALKTELSTADTETLAKINGELTKLWTEITDLVDDDIVLYETFVTTSNKLTNKVNNLKSSIDSSINVAKKDLTDVINNKETALKSLVTASMSGLSAELSGAKAELSDSIGVVKSAADAANKATVDSIKSLQDDVVAKHTELTGKIADANKVLDQYKTSTDTAFSGVDGKITSLNKKLMDTDARLAVDKERLDSQAKQISQIVRLEAGSTTGDAELANARIDYEGKEYGSVGEHIREIESSLMQHLGTEAISGLYYDTDGEVGVMAPYMLYLKNAAGDILPDTGVQIVSGAGGGSGGGGSTATSSLSIRFITPQNAVFNAADRVSLEFSFFGQDSSGDPIMQAEAEWKFNGVAKAKNTVRYDYNTFDVTKYLAGSETTVTVIVRDGNGSVVTKTWFIRRVELALESDFNDKRAYAAGESFVFTYKPVGTIEKKLIIKLDGELLRFDNTSDYSAKLSAGISGQTMTYENVSAFSSLTHGVHTLEAYLEATINDADTTRTPSIFKEIIVKDPNSTLPLISTTTQTVYGRQYDTVNIVYTVYDPKRERPLVDIFLDDSLVPVIQNKEISLNPDYFNTPTAEYSYNALEAGVHTVTIVCGTARRTINISIESIDTDLSPVTTGLVFDFNPALGDNSKLWEDRGVAMACSENFDWTNGGYKIDENGDPYFCIKAGTAATINYELFADNAKDRGKEFKAIFKTTNVRQRDTSFLSCLSDNIGIDMRVENATLYDGSTSSLRTDYCEDAIIEYEFNINIATDMMLVMSYEDGTPNKPYEYTGSSSFTQPVGNRKPIVIGSNDCDVHIYRLKAYNRSLSDVEIKNNFIADARNLDEKLARFNRNNIYDDGKLVTTSADGGFSVGPLMAAAPDLRYVFLEVPQFTNDKDNKIDGCTVYFRYPAGNRPQDNWTCTGVRHRGQGTSSNAYGYAGRNLDLCMDRDESLFTWHDKDADGNDITRTGSKITLTDTSVPTDYLNIKVNIASSENANNAELARRFNEYQPFKRYARKKDSRVKDTMEFYNCVVFIRETSTDTANIPHREFDDNNWHFYAIGNIGDSKKTDDTRVNNVTDPKEHVVEIMDVDVPLATFPRYIEAGSTTTEWAPGNKAYDILYSNEFVYDDEGAFESFGGTSFEFRYEMKKISDEQRMANITAWRNFYDFVVTSTDEEFYANLKDYFVVDSALYYYLFTERYTMVDNRAKNSFWHYGKVYISNEEATTLGATEASYYIIDDEAAAINGGYRYDLTFGYDMDTALGIDNTGDYIFAYGKEDTDYYRDGDPTSGPVFRADTSTFFCKLRDLFKTELRTMFKSREDANAWRSDALINQWDASQSKFPEELWRLDYERKYYRTYRGLSIDNSIKQAVDKTFLIGKFFGRKKYARRAFETNQEVYFATKYFGKTVASDTDTMWIRGNTNNGQQNYSITIIPYLDMYPLIKYGSSGSFQHGIDENGNPIRLKAGQPYTFVDSAVSRDFIYIGAPEWIQVIGDLSKCYISDSSFANGQRLQSLTIGDSAEGYTNSNLKAVSVTSNALLEHLDLSNVTGLEGELDLTANINLKTLKAYGTALSSISFAPGGKIAQVELPISVSKIVLKDLKYLSADQPGSDPYASYFALPNINNVQSLTIENCPNFTISRVLDKFSCTDDSGNRVLKNIRLTGMSFGNYTYDRFIADFDYLGGLDINGDPTTTAWLDGTIHFTGTLTGEQYNYVVTRYPELVITYDKLVSTLRFMDANGEQWADPQLINDNPNVANDNNGTNPASEDSKPYKESTAEFDYEFVSWSMQKDFIIGEKQLYDKEILDRQALNNIVGDRVLYPVFKESRRSYEVIFINPNSNGEDVELLRTMIPYGCDLVYPGTNPEKLDAIASTSLYTFIGWGDSLGNLVDTITANVTVYAQFAILDTTWWDMQLSEIQNGYKVDTTNKTITLFKYKNPYNKAVKIPSTFTIDGDTYSVTGIGGFLGHTKLELVSIPETATAISYTNNTQQGAFEGCTSLVEITLPEAIQSIGYKAFFGCSSLSEVHIPEMVSSIGKAAFSECTSLVNITVDGNNKYYIVLDGCGLVEKATNTLIQALPGAAIPETIEALGPYCFAKVPVETVDIPDGISIIPSNAFSGCKSLTTVHLPDSIHTLDATCFSGCQKLSDINLPEGLLNINTYIFNGCALGSVEIPSTVTKLGDHSFGNITGLKTVIFKKQLNADGTVFVPTINKATEYNSTKVGAFQDSGSAQTPIEFKLPWSETDHIAKFGSATESWGAKAAKLTFDYVEG